MIRTLIYVVLTSLLVACSPQNVAVDDTESQSAALPSPSSSEPALVTPAPANVPCGADNASIEKVLLACGDIAITQTAKRYPKMFYHFDPKVPQAVRDYVEQVGETYLPLYSGFFDKITDQAQIHVVLSLTPKWCGKALTETDDGTEEFLRENYCNQDGGANGGHGTARFAEFGSIILRPHPSEVDGILAGKTVSPMLSEIFVSELGHASRDVGSDALSGERGIAKWIPAWLQYVPNMFGGFYSGLREDRQVSDFTYATWGNRELVWRPTVTDKRFLPWNLGGELGEMGSPSLYNVAYLAARYLVPKHGLEAIERDLMGTLVSSNGNYDKAATAIGYASWSDLEAAVDASMLAFYEKVNIKVPKR